VQGVGFRFFVLRRARGLELKGTVRNLSDGTVEARAWGDEAALDALRAHLAQGPSHGRVEGVEESPLAGEPPSGDFEIVH
jgi:acylphosphatase